MVVAGIALFGEQVGPIDDFEAWIDGLDAFDEFGLER